MCIQIGNYVIYGYLAINKKEKIIMNYSPGPVLVVMFWDSGSRCSEIEPQHRGLDV